MRSGRKRINLDGKWRFDIFGCEPEDLAKVEPVRTIDVPACVERYFPVVTREQFYLYYERSFELAKRHSRRYFLHFGAVDYLCKVFLNDEKLGEHIGGYLPFEFEITQLILDNNRLQVLVFDPIGGGILDNRKIPHGKQNGEPNWYTSWALRSVSRGEFFYCPEFRRRLDRRQEPGVYCCLESIGLSRIRMAGIPRCAHRVSRR